MQSSAPLRQPGGSSAVGLDSRRLRLVTLLAFLGFFLVGGAWAIAMPWDGGPDEQGHITRAIGVVNGDFAAPPVMFGPNNVIPGANQTIPAGAERPSPPCFAFHPQKTPASCPPSVPRAATDTPVKAPTASGRYQPTYYAMVGWPLKWWPDDTGLLLARLISVALSAGFLAFAVRSILAWSRRPFMMAGLLVAVTPMVMHLAGVINPNSLETAAAIAMWAALIPVIFGDRPVDRRLLILAAVSASVVACVRPAGPMWVALALAVLLGTAGRARLVQLMRNRDAWLPGAAIAVACVASGIWTLAMKANQLWVPPDAGIDTPDAMRMVAVDRVSFYFKSMVGIFGWVDTELPTGYYAVWFSAFGFLVLTALIVGGRSDRWRLVLVGLAAFGPPMLSDASGTKGMFAQGRYILPSAVGIVMLAAYIIGERGSFTAPLWRSVIGWLAVLTLPSQLIGLAFTMIRYQHGLLKKVPAVNPLTGEWQPPLGSATALTTAVIGLAVLAVMVRLVSTSYKDTDGTQEAVKDEPAVVTIPTPSTA